MDNTTSVLNLKSFAQSIRLDCIELTYNLGETGAHIGGAIVDAVAGSAAVPADGSAALVDVGHCQAGDRQAGGRKA